MMKVLKNMDNQIVNFICGIVDDCLRCVENIAYGSTSSTDGFSQILTLCFLIRRTGKVGKQIWNGRLKIKTMK